MNVSHSFDVADGVRENEIESALGAFRLPCLSVLTTIGANGMSRIPALDFVGPIFSHWSARWRTWI
jgi:hypothetical protein